MLIGRKGRENADSLEVVDWLKTRENANSREVADGGKTRENVYVGHAPKRRSSMRAC